MKIKEILIATATYVLCAYTQGQTPHNSASVDSLLDTLAMSNRNESGWQSDFEAFVTVLTQERERQSAGAPSQCLDPVFLGKTIAWDLVYLGKKQETVGTSTVTKLSFDLRSYGISENPRDSSLWINFRCDNQAELDAWRNTPTNTRIQVKGNVESTSYFLLSFGENGPTISFNATGVNSQQGNQPTARKMAGINLVHVVPYKKQDSAKNSLAEDIPITNQAPKQEELKDAWPRIICPLFQLPADKAMHIKNSHSSRETIQLFDLSMVSASPTSIETILSEFGKADSIEHTTTTNNKDAMIYNYGPLKLGVVPSMGNTVRSLSMPADVFMAAAELRQVKP